MKRKFTYRQTDRHLAHLGIHEISEQIHLAKYQGIGGLRNLRDYIGLKGFEGLKGIYRDL